MLVTSETKPSEQILLINRLMSKMAAIYEGAIPPLAGRKSKAQLAGRNQHGFMPVGVKNHPYIHGGDELMSSVCVSLHCIRVIFVFPSEVNSAKCFKGFGLKLLLVLRDRGVDFLDLTRWHES